MHAPSRSGGTRLSLVAAVAAANLADGIVRMALPLVVLSRGATPSQAALVMSAGVAPWFVISLPVGAALDRVRPERWARRSNVTRAVLLGALAVGAAGGEPPIALWPAIAFCLGGAEVVADLAAQTLVPQVADGDRLPTLNAQLSGAQLATNQFLGPALGGLAVSRLDLGALGAAAALYVVAAIVLGGSIASPTPRIGDVPGARGLHELRVGLGYFRSRGDLVALAAVVGALNLGEEITRSTLPAFALDRAPLRLDEAALGLLVGLGGIGGLVGAVLAPSVARRLGTTRLVALAMPAIPATPLALALTPTPLVVGIAIVASSAAVPLCAVAIVTHRQRTTPTGLLGRTNATFQMIGLGASTLGGAVAALSIRLTSYRTTFAVAALIAAAAILTFRPSRALRTPPETASYRSVRSTGVGR